MAFVVLICLGLGGWHLLMTYGQFIEAEPALVGQPIKIRGRYFHFFYASEKCRHSWVKFEVLEDRKSAGYGVRTIGHYIGWGQFEFKTEMSSTSRFTTKSGIYTITLTPRGGRPVLGKLVVRPANDASAP
jgi:hypothetical protein